MPSSKHTHSQPKKTEPLAEHFNRKTFFSHILGNRHEYKMSGKQATKDFYSGEDYVTNLDGTLWNKRGVSRSVVQRASITYIVGIGCGIHLGLIVAGVQHLGRHFGWWSYTLHGVRIACDPSHSSSGETEDTAVYCLLIA